MMNTSIEEKAADDLAIHTNPWIVDRSVAYQNTRHYVQHLPPLQMATATINRRQWLKSGAIVTGSLAFSLGNLSNLIAAPRTNRISGTMTISEEELLASATGEVKARLSSNENPFGPSAKAKKAIAEAIDTSFRYPRLYTGKLTEKIAVYEGITKEHVLLGAGSGPLLHAASIYFGKDGGTIISGDPTYDSLPENAEEFFKAKWVKIPLTADFKLDLDAMEKAIDGRTVLVYLCNPNNPTATALDPSKLKAFCQRVSKRVPVFIDEAYIDYLENPNEASMISLVKAGYNVMVTRTFSKLYGFAGLRVGYMVAPPEMLSMLNPYAKGARSISATSANAALAAYQDVEFLQSALKGTQESKEFLYEVLTEAGYTYIPSCTNFVMFPIAMEGRTFTDEMMKRGVSVRFWKFNEKDWCRVSIGLMSEMKFFAEAFRQIA